MFIDKNWLMYQPLIGDSTQISQVFSKLQEFFQTLSIFGRSRAVTRVGRYTSLTNCEEPKSARYFTGMLTLFKSHAWTMQPWQPCLVDLQPKRHALAN